MRLLSNEFETALFFSENTGAKRSETGDHEHGPGARTSVSLPDEVCSSILRPVTELTFYHEGMMGGKCFHLGAVKPNSMQNSLSAH